MSKAKHKKTANEHALKGEIVEKACDWLSIHTMKSLCLPEDDAILVWDFIEAFKRFLIQV